MLLQWGLVSENKEVYLCYIAQKKNKKKCATSLFSVKKDCVSDQLMT